MIPQALEGLGAKERRRAGATRLRLEEEVAETMILAVTLKLQHRQLVLLSNLQNSMSQIFLLLRILDLEHSSIHLTRLQEEK